MSLGEDLDAYCQPPPGFTSEQPAEDGGLNSTTSGLTSAGAGDTSSLSSSSCPDCSAEPQSTASASASASASGAGDGAGGAVSAVSGVSACVSMCLNHRHYSGDGPHSASAAGAHRHGHRPGHNPGHGHGHGHGYGHSTGLGHGATGARRGAAAGDSGTHAGTAGFAVSAGQYGPLIGSLATANGNGNGSGNSRNGGLGQAASPFNGAYMLSKGDDIDAYPAVASTNSNTDNNNNIENDDSAAADAAVGASQDAAVMLSSLVLPSANSAPRRRSAPTNGSAATQAVSASAVAGSSVTVADVGRVTALRARARATGDWSHVLLPPQPDQNNNCGGSAGDESHTVAEPHVLRLQVVSDVHLERFPSRYPSASELAAALDDVIIPSAPVLVLAGDIGCPATRAGAALYLSFLQLQAGRFELVLVLAGNHEFYSPLTPTGPQQPASSAAATSTAFVAVASPPNAALYARGKSNSNGASESIANDIPVTEPASAAEAAAEAEAEAAAAALNGAVSVACVRRTMRELCRDAGDNVLFLDRDSVTFTAPAPHLHFAQPHLQSQSAEQPTTDTSASVRVCGATLWSFVGHEHATHVERAVSDYAYSFVDNEAYAATPLCSSDCTDTTVAVAVLSTADNCNSNAVTESTTAEAAEAAATAAAVSPPAVSSQQHQQPQQQQQQLQQQQNRLARVRRMCVKDTVAMHSADVAFLHAQVAVARAEGQRLCVLTHYPPTFSNTSDPRFKVRERSFRGLVSFSVCSTCLSFSLSLTHHLLFLLLHFRRICDCRILLSAGRLRARWMISWHSRRRHCTPGSLVTRIGTSTIYSVS